MIKIYKTYHFDLGYSWEIVENDLNKSKWIHSLTTGEVYPCDETFEGYQVGSKFKYDDIQIVPVPPVAIARLKYLAA